MTMAGLMHDLGHGPFSHLFDRGVISELLRMKNISKQAINNWQHEDASEMLFKHMIDKCELDVEKDELDPELICKLIHGVPRKNEDADRRWMFEIVANKRNSFDVDKLDYLCRDDYHCGLNQLQGHQDYTNYKIIFDSSRIIDNKLAYDVKRMNILNMVFEKRFENFRAIYHHKAAQQIDLMFQDILVKADPKFNFLDCLHKPEKYIHLTDNIIQRIQRSDDPRLNESKEIISRVQTRDLYKFVDEFFLQEWEWKEAIKL